jgi:hypothetical protein
MDRPMVVVKRTLLEFVMTTATHDLSQFARHGILCS